MDIWVTLFYVIIFHNSFWEWTVFHLTNPVPEFHLDMSGVAMEVNAEVSPPLHWDCVLAEIPTPNSIEECVLQNCTISESYIELQHNHFLNISIRLQVNDHPGTK
jgi:hypothetical protein